MLCTAVTDPRGKKHDRRCRREGKKADRTKGASSYKRSIADRKARDAAPRTCCAYMDDYDTFDIGHVEPPTHYVCKEPKVCGVCREDLCDNVCHTCVANDSDRAARELMASATNNTSQGLLASASAAEYDLCDWFEEDFGVVERANRYNDWDLYDWHDGKKHRGCNTHKTQSRKIREGTSQKNQAHKALTFGGDAQ